ncbi:phage tail tip lysozyme [Jatrophihabitans sp. YIM 134969]
MSERPRTSGPVIARVAAVLAALLTTTLLVAAPASAAPATPGGNGVGMSPNSGAVAAAIIRANEERAFRFFVSKGLTKVQAAGVVGNLDQESGMDPTIKQFGGGPGRGIAQWSVGGRWDTYAGDNVKQYAAGRGTSRLALGTQLNFIWYELTKFSYYGLSSLKAATTITAAVVAFQDKFEGCGDCNTAARVSYAQAAYTRYA